MNHWYQRRRRGEVKGIDNIFNKIIEENFHNLEKEKVIQVQEAFKTINRQVLKIISPRHMDTKYT
jgi:hypothetical protein